MPNRVLAFVRRVGGFILPRDVREPPKVQKDFPGAYALFMDEDEMNVIYAMSWPHLGCPVDERTSRTEWLINGQLFSPARRDSGGNWIFRRCVR